MTGALKAMVPRFAKEHLKQARRYYRLRSGAASGEPRFDCPICHYHGHFLPRRRSRYSECPSCGSLPRHRLEHLVMKRVFRDRDTRDWRVLYVAPEAFLRKHFVRGFGKVETADLVRNDVDHKQDLRDMSFADASFNMVVACHVLEHIDDDSAAIREVARVLRPGGVAILPVPIVAERTIEYGAPCAAECGHVRACGIDYYNRFRNIFHRVDLFHSEHFPATYQLHAWEDRSGFPTQNVPLRPPMEGHKHSNAIPVCWKLPGAGLSQPVAA